MDKINDFDKYIVIWADDFGARVYEPFREQEDAYQHMIEKLSEGKWACLSLSNKLPKIHYTHTRRRQIMASPRKKWYKRRLAELAEQEAKEAEVREAQPVPVAPPVEDVVIAPNSMKPTKPKKTRPLKSSRRSTKKAKKE